MQCSLYICFPKVRLGGQASRTDRRHFNILIILYYIENFFARCQCSTTGALNVKENEAEQKGVILATIYV